MRNISLVVAYCLLISVVHLDLLVAFSTPKISTSTTSNHHKDDDEQYDLVIIGAGASGLFASGAALSFGWKTLLLDQGRGYVGGDCSNAACVPSKALRSIARRSRKKDGPRTGNLLEAQEDIIKTVMAVRKREDISNYDDVKNLDLVLVESTQFVSEDEILIVPQGKETAKRRIRSKNFLIATGASPFVPADVQKEASAAGLPLFTYRSVLSPNDADNPAWKQFILDASNSSTQKRIVVAGGGPTAIELGQSLSRLNFSVTMIVPNTLLADEDVSIQQSACQILRNDGVHLRFGHRLVGVSSTNQHVLLSDGSQLPADALLVCIGRKPTIENLGLHNAGIASDKERGVLVHPSSLRSTTNPRVFACGDCCSAVRGKDRKAAHAAWTGYHAIRNMGIPWFLWAGSNSIHPTVPSVTYSDPELASVGMTRSECIEKYGRDGFDHLPIREEGMDRADMERKERYVVPCFVELRAVRGNGRILGLTACGPAAAELANEVGLAIESKLTVRDLARSIHSYPSHGYVLYRAALAMALSSVRGFLDTLGPVSRFGGRLYGGISSTVSVLQPSRLFPWKRAKRRQQFEWQASGQQSTIIATKVNDTRVTLEECAAESLPVSFLEYYESKEYTSCNDLPEAYTKWLDRKPMI